jgi:hypothetical protein
VVGWANRPNPKGEQTVRSQTSESAPLTVEAIPPRDTALDQSPRENANAIELDAEGETVPASVPVRPAVTAEASTAVLPSPARPSSRNVAAVRAAVRPAPSADAVGYLTFDTYPWTTVSEDGQPLGITPLVDVALPVGPHTLTLENPGQHMKTTYVVTIKPGDTFRRRLGFK